jgi:protease-4
MVAFLRWGRSLLLGTLNGIAKFVLVFVILLLVLFAIGLAEGDGLPGNMVLALDLRNSIPDSAEQTPFDFGQRPLNVMDIVLALDAAGRDPRVKGVWMRVGDGGLSVAAAEELGAALKRFRATGKYVIAHSQGFDGAGLGDYLVAASANQIWMQPMSNFGTSGEGGGEIFLKGLFDKIQADPQIAKRADYKSAADMYMEKTMTAPDREQLTVLMQSWYDWATQGIAADRNRDRKAVIAAFEASPQFTADAVKEGLVDKVGYDDDAYNEAIKKAGDGAKPVQMADYIRAQDAVGGAGTGPHIALIEASGEIVDGEGGGGSLLSSASIGGDELARAIRQATQDHDIKAIVLRVDSPGGSVSASDQILDAVKKARAKGKPVIVSMGSVAASGGYYISCDANEIVAEPGTITGSIGVLTGKVSFGKSLGLIGVGADQVAVGKNTLFDSDITPFTPDQWAALNHEADAIYADFTQKVADGRRMPLAKVQDVAKGRVWTGADASVRGLVDQLGGFWTATDAAKRAAGIPADSNVVFKRYPKQKTFFQALSEAFGGTSASARAFQGFVTLMNSPPVRAVLQATDALPRDGGIELRATNLPH